jgi:hypothetical protein
MEHPAAHPQFITLGSLFSIDESSLHLRKWVETRQSRNLSQTKLLKIKKTD